MVHTRSMFATVAPPCVYQGHKEKDTQVKIPCSLNVAAVCACPTLQLVCFDIIIVLQFSSSDTYADERD